MAAPSTAAPGETTPRTGIALIVLLIFTQMPAALAFTIPTPLLADMAADLVRGPADAYLVKLVSGILGPAMIVGAPLAGWLADRMDRRPLLAVIGLLYIAAGVAPALLTDLGAIIATRFVTGATGAAISTIGMAMVGDYFAEDRRAGMIGLLSSVSMGISIVALPLAGLTASGGWRHAFLLYLGMAPIVLLALLRSLPAPRRRPAAAEATSAPAGGRLSGFPLGLIAIAFTAGIVVSLPAIYISFHLAGMGVTSVSTIGLILMVNAALGMICSLSFGKLGARLSPLAIFKLCFAVSAVGLALLALAPSPAVVVAALVLTGMGMGWFVPAQFASAAQLVDEGRRGTLIGLVQGTGAIATLLGVTLLEPVVAAYGTRGIFLLIAAIAALSLLALVTALLRLKPTR